MRLEGDGVWPLRCTRSGSVWIMSKRMNAVEITAMGEA